jgi:hypothetical protein
MATIATQQRMNLEMNALQLKSDWHTRQVDTTKPILKTLIKSM